MSDHHRLSLDDAAAISGVDPEHLRESIRARFDGYPESTLRDRYVHFVVRERGINWLNHGEERTRNYLWSTTPFYSPAFFHYAMNCPPKQKRRSRLYRAFLSELAPAATSIEYVNFGASIDSLEYRIKQFGYDLLSQFPEAKSVVVDLLADGGGATDSDVAATVSELLDATPPGGDPFERGEVERVVRRGNYTDAELYVLHTVLAAARERPAAPRPTGA